MRCSGGVSGQCGHCLSSANSQVNNDADNDNGAQVGAVVFARGGVVAAVGQQQRGGGMQAFGATGGHHADRGHICLRTLSHARKHMHTPTHAPTQLRALDPNPL